MIFLVSIALYTLLSFGDVPMRCVVIFEMELNVILLSSVWIWIFDRIDKPEAYYELMLNKVNG